MRYLSSDLKKSGFYSAYGEDRFAADFFFGQRDGFYIDVGSGDPVLDSNTFFFYKNLGWRGVTIDPLKSNYLLHRFFRPRDHAILATIGNSKDSKIFIYPATEISTSSQKRVDELKLQNKTFATVRKSRCISLDKIVSR